jgi:hypothetical protein
MTPLCEIAEKFGTDKVKTHKDHSHDYTEAYYGMFQSMRGEVRRVLELGIGGGGYAASLRMWKEFFPNAEIYGGDWDRNAFVTEDRIHCFWYDQRDEKTLQDIGSITGGDFDIIIDDGSHEPAEQGLAAKVLYPLLKPNGYYVIEDVRDNNCVKVIETFVKQPHRVDARAFKGCDNRLFIIPGVDRVE